MAVNEVIVTGRKFRKLIDETAKLWQRISFWTMASDVEMSDGTSLENTINALKSTKAEQNHTHNYSDIIGAPSAGGTSEGSPTFSISGTTLYINF